MCDGVGGLAVGSQGSASDASDSVADISEETPAEPPPCSLMRSGITASRQRLSPFKSFHCASKSAAGGCNPSTATAKSKAPPPIVVAPSSPAALSASAAKTFARRASYFGRTLRGLRLAKQSCMEDDRQLQESAQHMAEYLRKAKRVVVLMGAGASVESGLSTYEDIKQKYFAVEETSGKLLVLDSRSRAPGGVALSYNELFTEGEGSVWEDCPTFGLLQRYKAISDAFCSWMVEKYSSAEPHQGYWDLKEVLSTWRAADPRREVLIATTNLDGVAMRVFGEWVHDRTEIVEMHGALSKTREHSARSQDRAISMEKPLVMHFGGRDQYYGPEGFSDLTRETRDMREGFDDGPVAVIEIGSSEMVNVWRQLRTQFLASSTKYFASQAGVPGRSLLDSHCEVFLVNPAYMQSAISPRKAYIMGASSPKGRFHRSLHVVPFGFKSVVAALKRETSRAAS